MDFNEKLYKLTEIGIALSSERNLTTLLEKIVAEARAFTNAEGGSLYIREQNLLKFNISQNSVLSNGQTRQRVFFSSTLPLNSQSLAGYAALHGKILNIPNVYKLPATSPYKFNRSFDEQNHYRTKSMLVVPMQDSRRNIVGVLALINARSPQGQLVAFNPDFENLVLCLASQAAVAIKNIQLTQQLKDAYLDTIIRLSMAAECRDADISGHLQRISEYSAILAQELGLAEEQVENIRYASPMHDVGKIGICDAILLKNGKLTEEEYEEMKKHPIFGAKILSDGASDVIRLSEEIALNHHEKYDGSGYPYGKKGEQIPLAGRIVALADVFDALASKRAYKDAWDIEAVVDYIREHSNSHFDPKVVAAFERRLQDFFHICEKYPGAIGEV